MPVVTDAVAAFLTRAARGTRRTNAELVAQLASLSVTDDATRDLAARLVTRLLTKAPLTYMQARLGASHWQARIDDRAQPSRFSRLVVSRMNRVNRRAFERYEADDGSTRATMHRLDELAEHPEHMVPYFEVLVQNATAAIFGEHEADQARLADEFLPRLLGADALLLRWIEDVLARGGPLKHVGGDTNTIVGVYDWIRDDPELGFARVPTDCDDRFDLGAGFGTPYLESLFGVPLLALDLHAPSDARGLGLSFAVRTGGHGQRRAMNAVERDAYLERLDRQPWRRYDVFEEPLPARSDRVLVVSFGFLSSTVSSLSPLGQQLAPKLRPLLTTYTCVRRILDCAGPGKDVSLFTVQRATAKAYMNRAVFLRLVDGRLCDHGLAAEPHQGRYVRGVIPAGRRG